MTEQHQNILIGVVNQSISKPINNSDGASYGMDMDTTHPITTDMVSYGDDNSKSQLSDICKTVDMLTSGTEALNGDNEGLNEQLLRVQVQREELDRGVGVLKSSIQEERIFLDALKPNQEILSQDVASLNQYAEDLESVSYDGILIWKIQSVREKMRKISTFLTGISKKEYELPLHHSKANSRRDFFRKLFQSELDANDEHGLSKGRL